MALSEISTDILEVEQARVGMLAISFDNFTSTAVDQMTAGSWIECAGTVYKATAPESIDSTATLAGLGAGTNVYVYFSPATLQLYCSGTSPTYSTSKQGFYGTVGTATHRCIYMFYKVAAGNYTNKTILTYSYSHGITNNGISLLTGANANKDIIFASDYKLSWLDAKDRFADLPSHYISTGANGPVLKQLISSGGTISRTMYVKKPITAIAQITGVGGSAKIYLVEGATTRVLTTFAPGTTATCVWNPSRIKLETVNPCVITLRLLGVYGIGTTVSAYDSRIFSSRT